jgi:phosphoribosylformimino-5-aminoimidazole carboxamide ribotide isomerase
MDIYPAIDIKGGKCVRLSQGEKDREVIYSDDPVTMALKWQNDGAGHLHVVDLDGAFEGSIKNMDIVEKIVTSVDMFVQLGGGIRSLDIIEDVLNSGIKRVIIGTKAYEDEQFVEDAVKEFGQRIAVGLDTRKGRVAIKGWTETTQAEPVKMALKLQKMGVKTIVYTDILTDGMMSGPNLPAIEELLDQTKTGIIASGGITTYADISNLKKLENKGLVGAVIGKALYEERLNLSEIV